MSLDRSINFLFYWSKSPTKAKAYRGTKNYRLHQNDAILFESFIGSKRFQ